MATTETRTSSARDSAPRPTYDGFMSYSHSADDPLAPRLQAALQRFAKPWWNRRAMRIFRDEASLSANPHLWSSITEALDDSGWFILLLSPAAAESGWVNREVEYWLEHKDPNRIIPVLTDGEFAWVDGDVASNAAPPALSEVFTDEPRWVDLRSARTEEQLDLNNASFRAAVADIASAVRGVPKDELESEEVRQHRRTIRTAWAGGLALLLLAVVATGAAIYAGGQRAAAQESETEATRFAVQVLDHSDRLQSDAAPAGSDIPADQRNIPLPVAELPPASPRLAFLEVTCFGEEAEGVPRCFANTFMLHPEEPLIASAWLAYEPFHIREGFVNPEEAPLGSAFPPDYDILVFVTRRQGPALAEGMFQIDVTYRFTADYLVRENSERCGPGFLDQSGPLPCDEFVHEFSNGLPPGVYDIWVGWQAPCSFWTTADVCGQLGPLSLFSAVSDDMGFYHDTFRPAEHNFPDPEFRAEMELAWPFDPWRSAEELNDP